MEGVIGDPVEPSPSYRPCPRALLGRPLAFPFSQSKAAMSCRRGFVRWRASMAAAELSSHVMPTLASAMAGIYGCGLSLSSFLS